MFAYGFAAFLLWMRAARVDSILAGSGQMEDDQVTKHTQGVDYMPKVRWELSHVVMKVHFERCVVDCMIRLQTRSHTLKR